MGAKLSTIAKRVFGKKQVRILMVGLDSAGKTTILHKLKLDEIITTIPTIGFNVDNVFYKNICFTVWDVGGQDGIRPFWHHYYINTQAIIFVVDSNDRERIDQSQKELQNLLETEELKNAIILILANKQDIPEAMTVQEICESLKIQNCKDRCWYVHAVSAKNGYGLYESLDWLSKKLLMK